MNWNTAATTIESLGSTAARPGSLSGLAAARRQHLSQFFTPSSLVDFMWRIAQHSMDQALADANHPHAKLNLFDNSVGSGRLLSPADPTKHRIAGLDIHEDSITALMMAAKEAGFERDFITASMTDVQPSGYHLAFINPPFSLNLKSPLLSPYDCTTYGPYGPNTAAPSHAYALEQALESSEAVIAVMPSTYAETLIDNPTFEGRLSAVIRLPAGSFREEGTDVTVSLAVFSRLTHTAPLRLTVSDLDQALPVIDLDLTPATQHRAQRLRSSEVNDEAPTITLPITGETTVRVAHNGRKLFLKFFCGLTQAKVMNAVLQAPVPRPEGSAIHRYPKAVRFVGQGLLDLENYLAQPDPLAALAYFEALLTAAGATPQIDAGLPAFLKRRHRRNQRENTPFRHTILTAGHESADTLCVTPKKAMQMNPARWGSAILKPDQALTFGRKEALFTYTHANGETLSLDAEALKQSFNVPSTEPQWQVVHEGREVAFPEVAKAIRAEL